MARLKRFHVPVEVRCRVLLRQLGEAWPDEVVDAWRYRRGERRSLSLLHEGLMAQLSGLLGCQPSELRLDHDPAIALRRKVCRKGVFVDYDPPYASAVDLRYRPHGAQYEGSHHIKTNVRGDGAQHPDRVLIKRERRRQKAEADKRKPRIVKRSAKNVKRKWQARPLRSANRWPPKGSRKINWKRG